MCQIRKLKKCTFLGGVGGHLWKAKSFYKDQNLQTYTKEVCSECGEYKYLPTPFHGVELEQISYQEWLLYPKYL